MEIRKIEKIKLVILGAGGYGKTVLDLACQLGYSCIVLDDNSSKPLSLYASYISDSTYFIPAFGNNEFRMKWINQLVSSLGLTTIHLHSYTTNPMAELEASSIYLLPSLFEGFPLVVLECMSVGVPCVAFDCPCGPSEIIKDGEDGFVTPFLDYNAFVDKVCYLMEHDDVRKEMGRKAQENIKRFNLDSIMGKWMDLFNSL